VAGPAGPAGPKGEAGPAGPAGSAGASATLRKVTTSGEGSCGGELLVSAYCVGGGEAKFTADGASCDTGSTVLICAKQ
jgi:hypothetical protein